MASKNRTDHRAEFVAALMDATKQESAPPADAVFAEAFVTQLLNTIDDCSRTNIQLCTAFILQYVGASHQRYLALKKFLLSLMDVKPGVPSKATQQIGKDEGKEAGPEEAKMAALPAYTRLHTLYIVSDVVQALSKQTPTTVGSVGPKYIDAVKGDYPSEDPAQIKFLCLGIALMRHAACQGSCAEDQVFDQLYSVLSKWKSDRLISEADGLEAIISSPYPKKLSEIQDEYRRQDEYERSRWIQPARHGHPDDPNAPWYHLPAANGLQMRRTRGAPLRPRAFPHGGFELEGGGKEATEDLKVEVRKMYRNILKVYEDAENGIKPDEIADVDLLGQPVWKDPAYGASNFWGLKHAQVEAWKDIEKKNKQNLQGYADVDVKGEKETTWGPGTNPNPNAPYQGPFSATQNPGASYPDPYAAGGPSNRLSFPPNNAPRPSSSLLTDTSDGRTWLPTSLRGGRGFGNGGLGNRGVGNSGGGGHGFGTRAGLEGGIGRGDGGSHDRVVDEDFGGDRGRGGDHRRGGRGRSYYGGGHRGGGRY